MTYAGTWGKDRSRVNSTRSNAPSGLGGGFNAQGSAKQYRSATGAPKADTGQAGAGSVKYGGMKTTDGVKQPSWFDSRYQLQAAGRMKDIEQQRTQTAYDLERMRGQYERGSTGLSDQRDMSYDQMYQQLGAGNMARSGMRGMGGAQITNDYNRSLFDLQQQLGSPAQRLQQKLLDIAEDEYTAAMRAEQGVAAEREQLRDASEPVQFTASPGIQYTNEKNKKKKKGK